MRTNLERYLKLTVQMPLAREDGKDDGQFLDELDKIWATLPPEEIEFAGSFRR